MRKSILFIISLFLCMNLFAQQKTTFVLNGTVIDEKGDTAPGATVYLKDKIGIGTATDVNGKFSFKNVSIGNIIVVSFLGYETMEYMVAKAESDIIIQLSTTDQKIDEVVVVGIGSKRKISSVGAISTLDVSELQIPTTSLANLLGGKVAGVISRQVSGEPGKNIAEFWVRGIGTFGYNSGALVLIDGLEGDINNIDPADIESFSILKDASATAIYGVRGANGVVIITTKKGEAGKLRITGRANFSVSHLTRMPEYLRAYDYAKLANEARQVRGEDKLYNDIELAIIQKGLDLDIYPDVDWQDEVMNKNSMKQSYYVSARGGGEIAQYFLSLGTTNETAAYKVDKNSIYASNVGYNTYSYRTNLDLHLTKSTSVYFGADGFLSVHKTPGVSNTNYLWSAQSQIVPLTFPVIYSTGDLPAAGGNEFTSPSVLINNTGYGKNEEYRGKVTISVNQDLSMLLDGLKFSIQGAYDLSSYFSEQRHVMPSLKQALGRNGNGDLIMTEVIQSQPISYGKSTDQYRKYFLKNTLSYNKLFGKDHRISALLNHEISDQKRANDGSNNLNSIPIRYQSVASWLTYSFRDTYMMDINFGYAGTENFQPGRQYGFFPSIGIGWIPTGYDWVTDHVSWLNFFKIRATIGSVGNDRITNVRFPYLTKVSSGSSGIFGGNSVTTMTESHTGADNLAWEKSIKSDIGIDAHFFDEKLSLTVDIFNDERDGIFQQRVQVPEYVGLVNMPFGNVGSMRSYGADGNGSYIQKINQHTRVTIRGNFSYSKNVVKNWEQLYTKYPYQDYNGYPNSTIWGYQAIGFFRDQDDINYSPSQPWGAVMPGDIKYKDVNGDGKIYADDMVPLSYSTFPLLMYGFGAEYQYKNFSLGVMFKGTGKTDYYPVRDTEGWGYIPFRGGWTGNVLSLVNDPKNRWIPMDYALANGIDPALAENPNARFPRLQYGDNLNNRQISDFWKADCSYLRLQEVTLNYNLKNNFLKKIGVTSIDLQLIGSNLFVWDKVKIFDPEQARYTGREYPIPAVYSFQLYINL